MWLWRDQLLYGNCATMTHSYVAFIDESGDDGLSKFREPGGTGGASSWLVLSACLFRKIHSLDAVAWRDEISNRMPEKKSRVIHFANMNHNQRVLAAQVIADKPLRVVSVLSAKRTIPPGIYTQKNQLYFYMARYLIERLSWLCRDLRSKVPEGDGRVAIMFSRRGRMPYDQFRAYLQHLKDAQETEVFWPVIDIEAVDAQDHSRNAGLQLVDAVASSFANAVEPDLFGNCEPRYAEILKRVTYCRQGNYLSYGVKLVPKHEDCGLSVEQNRLITLFT